MSCGEEFTVEEFIRDLPGYHGLVVAGNRILPVDERSTVDLSLSEAALAEAPLAIEPAHAESNVAA